MRLQQADSPARGTGHFMQLDTTVSAVILGIVEGLTEFLPVSSTAHILLLGKALGFDNPGKTFEVLIQLGAILAILTVYSGRLWTIGRAFPTEPKARRFVAAVVIAFLPAALIGVAGHRIIKEVLFESPYLICTMLIVGGIVLLWVDRMALRPRFTDVMEYPLGLALRIGLFQMLALVPGVSRSGATIVGSLLMGTDKRSAAEFSFFLAMPTMAGAFAYDLYQNRALVDGAQIGLVAVGFAAAFIAAVLVVRSLLDFVSRHGFAPFGWWRILVGGAGILLLATFNGPPAAITGASSGGVAALELAVRAEADEIGRQDGGKAGGIDAEIDERALLAPGRFGDDIVEPELTDLIGGQELAGQMLKDRRGG
jgi:undecaprenyl-diphosphatase